MMKREDLTANYIAVKETSVTEQNGRIIVIVSAIKTFFTGKGNYVMPKDCKRNSRGLGIFSITERNGY